MSNWLYHSSYGFEPTLWWLTTWAVKMPLTFHAGWNGFPISPQWLLFQPLCRFTVPASSLSKQLFLFEGNLILHNIVCCPGQFVRKGIVGDHEIGLLHLEIVVGSCLRIIAPCQLSSLGKGPGQVSVAVFLVSFALFLPIVCPFGGDLSGVEMGSDFNFEFLATPKAVNCGI